MKDGDTLTQSVQIGWERMPVELIRALAIQKKAAARANVQLGLLDASTGKAIEATADETRIDQWLAAATKIGDN